MAFYSVVHDFALEEGWVLGRLLAGGEPVLNQEDLKKHPHLSCSVSSLGSPLPFTFAHPNFPVISSTLADLLAIPGQTELLPVQILQAGQTLAQEYFVLYITQQVDVIDRAQSIFDVWTPSTHPNVHKHGTYKHFHKLTLDERKVEGLSIFKLQEYRVLTIVNSALKARLTSRSTRGVVFRPL